MKFLNCLRKKSMSKFPYQELQRILRKKIGYRQMFQRQLSVKGFLQSLLWVFLQKFILRNSKDNQSLLSKSKYMYKNRQELTNLHTKMKAFSSQRKERHIPQALQCPWVNPTCSTKSSDSVSPLWPQEEPHLSIILHGLRARTTVKDTSFLMHLCAISIDQSKQVDVLASFLPVAKSKTKILYSLVCYPKQRSILSWFLLHHHSSLSIERTQ